MSRQSAENFQNRCNFAFGCDDSLRLELDFI